MSDWGPLFVAVVLFILFQTSGASIMVHTLLYFALISVFLLAVKLPGRRRVAEFGSMQTSGMAILVHTIIFFGLLTIFLIVIGVHIYTG
ncbi:calmodulin-binding transcription activator [Salix suchowensis]|nr:calmodulin-binding transcription activator [Salix suchowensis]